MITTLLPLIAFPIILVCASLIRSVLPATTSTGFLIFSSSVELNWGSSSMSWISLRSAPWVFPFSCAVSEARNSSLMPFGFKFAPMVMSFSTIMGWAALNNRPVFPPSLQPRILTFCSWSARVNCSRSSENWPFRQLALSLLVFTFLDGRQRPFCNMGHSKKVLAGATFQR